MSLLRKNTPDPSDAAVEETEADLEAREVAELEEAVAAGKMPGKGRPTPKRREAERRRGPVAPPPRSQREAYKRSKKEQPKLTKEEKRTQSAQRRERMMKGEDAYLLPRDKGAVRAYVRDVVDARRNFAGLLLPIALLSFLTLAVPSPFIQDFGPVILMVMIVGAVIDSYILGRRISREVRIKFPKGDKSNQTTKGSALGFYAFNRACLIRKWRVPRPRVERGEIID